MCIEKTLSLWSLPYHMAQRHLKHNPYIRNGYRGQLTPIQSFYSIFKWNNETINIWSHLMGFVVFMGLMVYDYLHVYQEFKGTRDDFVVVTFVLVCFMLCMILSSLYHTFNCCSKESNDIWLSRDIFGIAASFFAIFLSGIYYGFWCDKYIVLRYTYSLFVCVLFAGAMVFLLTPRLMSEEWEWTRNLLFVSWSASGVVPTIHWTILHGGFGTDIVMTFFPRIVAMYAISLMAFLVYLFKFPEKFWPGRFDYIGASHQLWHLIIVAALLHWHQTGLTYAEFRLVHGCNY
ncbi:progestin and adipoQ receptor family member 3 [Oratosquilla oratoria]|uniref:progestin and adipoQ receptor family member 3 n=1 Tax=Oratosquilla oratoria TaxID=337810 RepID=UPI003F75DD13